MSKTHIHNVIKIAVGAIDQKRKQRRRRRRNVTTKPTNKGLQYNNLLREMMELNSRVHNVSNPSNSNSSTLMTKVNQLENEKKLKELENKIDESKKTIVRSAPLPLPSPEPSLVREIGRIVENLTLRDRALGFNKDFERPEKFIKEVQLPPHSTISQSSSKPLIEEVATTIIEPKEKEKRQQVLESKSKQFIVGEVQPPKTWAEGIRVGRSPILEHGGGGKATPPPSPKPKPPSQVGPQVAESIGGVAIARPPKRIDPKEKRRLDLNRMNKDGVQQVFANVFGEGYTKYGHKEERKGWKNKEQLISLILQKEFP